MDIKTNLVLAVMSILGVSAGLRAQQRDHPAESHVHKATVGAGTDSGTTTGSSEPSTNSGKNKQPPIPTSDLCKEYQGDVYKACVETVANPPSKNK